MIPLGFIVAVGGLVLACMGVALAAVWACNRIADAVLDDGPAE